MGRNEIWKHDRRRRVRPPTALGFPEVTQRDDGFWSSFVATDELIEAWRSTPQSLADSESESIWLKNGTADVVDYRDTRLSRDEAATGRAK